VGSGKSTVAQLFSDLGVGIVDTDVISRELTAGGGAALPAIVDRFGAEFIGQDGALNRQAMRNWVFSDSAARQELENILHPLIREEAAQRLCSVEAHYVLLVVPLLAEHLANYRALVDRIAVVDCEEAQQLQRILSRSSLNTAQATAILAAQCSRVARLSMADDVIDNRGDLGALTERVAFLHGQYLLAARGNKHQLPTTHCNR
jgi:dephospho-CoA kinase